MSPGSPRAPAPRAPAPRAIAPAVAAVCAVVFVAAVAALLVPLWARAEAVPTSRSAAAEPESGTVLHWPLSPRPEVLRQFDPPDTPYGPGHRGVDLSAAPGHPVLAAADGHVVHAGELAGRGVVSIEHAGGMRTTYEPVRAADDLSRGDEVAQGQVVGAIAGRHAGCPEAACLHWGLRRGEEYLDPLRFVPAAGPLRLKPWPD